LTANFAATVFITHDLDLAITYANRVVLLGGKKILADGTPEEVLQNYDLLAQGRIRPTSLLDLNRRYLPQTGHFLPAEALARL
jgi:energy-coupling factor transport system ATP-binding protein